MSTVKRSRRELDPVGVYDPYRPRQLLTPKQREARDDLEARDSALAKLVEDRLSAHRQPRVTA